MIRWNKEDGENGRKKIVDIAALDAAVLKKVAGGCIIVILLLLLFSGSFFSVDQGNRGLVLRFGKVVSVADPGLHLKMPFVDDIVDMNVRTQKEQIKLQLYSKDIQAATAIVSVNFKLLPAFVAGVYERYGRDYVDTIIKPQLLAQPKDVFGKYNAVDIVQNREQLSEQILKGLSASLENTGIDVQSVQLENIDFSDSYEKSVEERMKAEVEVQKVLQNEKRMSIEANMKRIQAKADADAKILAAQAEADAIRLRGEAEAKAIEAKSAAIAKNPVYVNVIQAERWDGKLPQTMLPSQALPIIGK